MFNLDDFLQLEPRELYREDVFASAPKAPVIIEWWKPHPVYRMHKHADFEEFAITRQGVSVHYHRDNFQLLTPGDAIYIGTENPHGYVCTHNLGLFNVVFHSQYFYSYSPEVKDILTNLKTLSKNKNSLRITAENLLQTLSIVYRIEYENSLHFDDYTSSSMFSLFLQIAIMLLRDNTETYQSNEKIYREQSKQLETLRKVITLTRQHIELPISEISAKLNDSGLNNKTIQRHFLKHMHITLYQYIQLQKLVLAMNYILENPNGQLSDILANAGYTNYRGFSRHIQQFFGTSPKEFQNNILKIRHLSDITPNSSAKIIA